MKIAILGCGSIGRRHLNNLIELGQSDLIAYDPAKEARQQCEQAHAVRCFPELDAVWEAGPEIALVTAPSNLHRELAMRALEQNCHLFIEKPVSHSLDGLEALQAEADRRGLTTMVGCNMRFHPGPAEVHRLLESGRIGQPISARIQTGSYLPRWRPHQDYRKSYSASDEWGGAILDCIHELDLAHWYFGPAELLCSVSVPAATIGLTTDGLTELLLRHRSGALSSVHLNYIQRDYRRGCQIIGSEGTLYWDFAERAVRVYGEDGELAERISEPEGWEPNRMYVDELAHFLAAVASANAPMNPVSEAAETLRIALGAREAPG